MGVTGVKKEDSTLWTVSTVRLEMICCGLPLFLQTNYCDTCEGVLAHPDLVRVYKQRETETLSRSLFLTEVVEKVTRSIPQHKPRQKKKKDNKKRLLY